MTGKKKELTNWGPLWWMSGAMGFFGEGYRYHKKTKWVGFWLVWLVTFVGKTTTLNGRKGNMPLSENDQITPIEERPKCIVVRWIGHVLNAVGLSGPGWEFLCLTGKCQARIFPYMISFMSLADTMRGRYNEFMDFLKGFCKHFSPEQRQKVVLQVNLSCPNVCVVHESLSTEMMLILNAAQRKGLNVVFKVNALIDPEIFLSVQHHPSFGGICVTNTIHWDLLPKELKLKAFGSLESPLTEYGGGGYSGKWLLPLVVDWVKKARVIGLTCHINAGGGILTCMGMMRLWLAGADSISIGGVAFLRFWRIWRLVLCAYLLKAIRDIHKRQNWFYWKGLLHSMKDRRSEFQTFHVY